MATFTPVLRTSKEYNPVHIRIIHNTKPDYIKTDFIVHKSGIQNGKIMDSLVLAKCALLINSYYDKLRDRDISTWTVQELKKYLLTEQKGIYLMTDERYDALIRRIDALTLPIATNDTQKSLLSHEQINVLIMQNEKLISRIDTLVQAIDPNSTHKMIVTAFQVGFQRAMETVGEKPQYISQSKAWKIYGRGRIERWVAAGLIQQKQAGGGKTSTIRYEVARLMELDASNIKIK